MGLVPDTALAFVRLTGPEAVLREFLTRYPTECERVRRDGDRVTLDLLATAQQVDALRGGGVVVQVLFDANERGRALREQVGTGNRFAGGRVPCGLGLPRAKPVADSKVRTSGGAGVEAES